MSSNFSLTYNVDIAMCIDATGSMGNLLETVKTNALSFYSDLVNSMSEKGKHIDELRVRVIAFRDYIADGKNAILATDFFALPEESEDFKTIVSSIKPAGGGDDPEDGLEALAYAIKSKWTNGGSKRRHIIIVWSDDGTHPLGFGSNPDNYTHYNKRTREEAVINTACYPQKMAKDFDELTEWWGDCEQIGLMDSNAKRLLIFAPEKAYWSTISDTWDNVIHFPSEAGKGLLDLEYKEILDAIANSI